MSEEKQELKEGQIIWSDFESKYLHFDEGEQKTLYLSNWREEWKQYNENERLKPVITFDVLKEGDTEYKLEQKFFTTGALSFVADVKPIIERAEAKKAKYIRVVVKYSKEKKYTVVEL